METSAHCTCGKVNFYAKEKPVIQLVCHCSDCRDATSNDYSMIAFFNLKSTDISGDLSLNQYISETGKKTVRECCSQCRTVMLDRSEGFPSLVGVMASNICAPFEISPACHVWVQSKLAHVSIPDDVKQYEKGIE